LPELQGAVSATSDYDEGVYASAGKALSNGILPYKDFTFLHPPGLPAVLAGINTVLGPLDSFLAARVILAAAGAATAGMVFVAGRQVCGRFAGVIAGALYATFPAAVVSDGRILLEPLQNLFAIAGSVVFFARPGRRTAILAGILFGAAVSVKLTGVVYVAALTIGVVVDRRRLRDVATTTVAAATSFLVFLAPFAVSAGPSVVIHQVIGSQLERPSGSGLPGNTSTGFQRLSQIMAFGPAGGRDHLANVVTILLLAIFAAVVVLGFIRSSAPSRFWSISLILGAVLLLRAPSFYLQYPLLTGPAIAVLSGAALTDLLARSRFGSTTQMAVALSIVVALVGWQLKVQTSNFGRSSTVFPREALVAAIHGCAYSDDKQYLLLADIEPQAGTSRPLIDPFGAQLQLGSPGASSAIDAIRSDASQTLLRTAIESCPATVFFGRPEERYTWSAGTVEWFKSARELSWSEAGIEVWVKRASEK